MADFWSNLGNAFSKAWGDVTTNIGNEWNSGHGAWAALDTLASPITLPLAGIGNLVAPAEEAVNKLIPAGVTLGGGYGTNGGYIGTTPPAAVPGSWNVEGQVDNATAPSTAPQTYTPPSIQSVINPPSLPPSNSSGTTPIQVAAPQPTPPTSVGMSPVPTGDSEAYKSDQSQYWNPTTSAWGNTPYIAPVAGDPAAAAPYTGAPNVAAADPAAPSNHYNVNDMLAIGSTAAAVGTSLWNGKQQADAQIEAAKIQAANSGSDRSLQKEMFDKLEANHQPYVDAGKKALGQLETFDTDHPMGEFKESPDYAWRFSEAMRGLSNSASARTGIQSGNAMVDTMKLGGNMASAERDNWWNRETATRGTQRGALQSIAGLGQSAVNQVGQLGQNYAANAGQSNAIQANALANGVRGAADANASAYQNATTALINGTQSYIKTNQENERYNALLKMINESGKK